MKTARWLWLCWAVATFGAVPLPPHNEQSARTMRLEKFIVPEFPTFLRQTGVMQGSVVVAIGHDAKGKPDDVLVLESSEPHFTDATLDAIRHWRFETGATVPPPSEAPVPVVRFFFTSGNVSIVPLTTSPRSSARRPVRADTPVELPNFSHLDVEPKPLHRPMPEFPPSLRGKTERGTALVKYFVDPEGRARVPVAVHATEPQFAAAALEAVRKWRFEPPRIDGRPVVALEMQFFQFGPPAP
jgi:TonB family protein